MGNDPAIRVRDLGKRYRIGQIAPYKTLRDAIAHAVFSRFRRTGSNPAGRAGAPSSPGSKDYIWALRNVSFEVQHGDAVGVIGPNGAGKSTLLKVLSRITESTEGWAQIRGRVSSLLEVGTGFHHELTGRENIFLNGAILGMTRAEIERKFEDIVKFAEIEKFIDTPVKWYSDGMRVRLGFAVAAHLEPEILIVDEVLAVGDAAFQRKCLGKMEGVASEGRTVIFVSHNMAAIQNLCTVAYGLDHGRIFATGNVNDVITQYLENYDRLPIVPLGDRTDRRGTGKVRLTGVSISGAMSSSDTIVCGSPVTFGIAYEAAQRFREVDMSVFFYDQYGTCVLVAASDILGKTFAEIKERGKFFCRFDKFPMLPGTYRLALDCSVKGVAADFIKDAVTIHVVEGDYYGSGKLPPKGWGHVAASHDWDLETDSGPPAA